MLRTQDVAVWVCGLAILAGLYVLVPRRGRREPQALLVLSWFLAAVSAALAIFPQAEVLRTRPNTDHLNTNVVLPPLEPEPEPEPEPQAHGDDIPIAQNHTVARPVITMEGPPTPTSTPKSTSTSTSTSTSVPSAPATPKPKPPPQPPAEANPALDPLVVMARAANRHGMQAYLQKSYKEAILAFNEAIECNPEDFRAFYHRGLCHFQLGNMDAALKDFDQALSANGQQPNVRFSRAWLHYRNKMYAKAIDDFNVVIQLEPQNLNAYRYRGLAHRALGQTDAAARDARMAETIQRQRQLPPPTTPTPTPTPTPKP